MKLNLWEMLMSSKSDNSDTYKISFSSAIIKNDNEELSKRMKEIDRSVQSKRLIKKFMLDKNNSKYL